MWEVEVCAVKHTQSQPRSQPPPPRGYGEREDGGEGKPKPTPLYERTYTCITTGGDR